MSRRERAARAIYRLRPFRTAMSNSPLDGHMVQSRVFDFESAPAFYQHDCFEIADAVLGALNPRRQPTRTGNPALPGSECHSEPNS